MCADVNLALAGFALQDARVFTLDTTPPTTTLVNSTYPYQGSARSTAFGWTAADMQPVRHAPAAQPACPRVLDSTACRAQRARVWRSVVGHTGRSKQGLHARRAGSRWGHAAQVASQCRLSGPASGIIVGSANPGSWEFCTSPQACPQPLKLEH